MQAPCLSLRTALRPCFPRHSPQRPAGTSDTKGLHCLGGFGDALRRALRHHLAAWVAPVFTPRPWSCMSPEFNWALASPCSAALPYSVQV